MHNKIINLDAKCPHCQRKIDGASNPEGKTPSKDDLSVCVYCQTVLQFNEDMTLRVLSDEERYNLPYDVRVALIKMQRICRLTMHLQN